ncbi:MAG: peptidyl-prolyl cis-trans isomerase [Anaerolineae bacterium]|nr:peptidyl-prolyl cis-trans isomerase [Anaerolineae bacterium]
MTQDELVGLVRDRLTAVKLAAVLTKDLPTTAEQVHARHILVKTEDEAKKVIDRLKAGEEFGKLAGELSTDPGGKSNGGDLGWFGRGMMVPPFEEAAFALPVKQVSQPVQSQFGYHVIEVLEKDAARALPQEQVDQQREDKLVGWLEEQRKAANIEQFLTIEQ